jgi:chemotaxis protein MotB
MVRPGRKTGVGTVLYFPEEQIDLNDEHRSALRQQADLLQGKPQKLEIRGHTSVRPTSGDTRFRDNWDISYERCRQVMKFLVDDLHIDSRRLRISAAAANEPLYAGTDTTKLERNPRVEVYLLDEVVRETMGTEEEQDARFAPDKNAGPSADNLPPANR